MRPGVYNTDRYRGDSFLLMMRLREAGTPTVPGPYINLTGRTVFAQLRDAAVLDGGLVLAPFTSTILDQAAVPGGITIALPPVSTLALPDITFFDVEVTITATGWKRTYVRGTINWSGDYSRA